jgi:imidazolonepropionase-like amidohydrolase
MLSPSVPHSLDVFLPAAALAFDAAATIEPARLSKQDKTSGSVTAGKVADLFVVDGDPLARIEDAAKVVTTAISVVRT